MRRWEYKVVDTLSAGVFGHHLVGFTRIERLTMYLNVLGAQGWALTTCLSSTTTIWIFRRRVSFWRRWFAKPLVNNGGMR